MPRLETHDVMIVDETLFESAGAACSCAKAVDAAKRKAAERWSAMRVVFTGVFGGEKLRGGGLSSEMTYLTNSSTRSRYGGDIWFA